MKSTPKILISLVNWYKYDDTINCVKSIWGQDYRNFEISIVDNNSPNNSYEKLKEELPEIRIIKSAENNGYAAGHKINVDYALTNEFDAIWILNSDLVVKPQSLKELVKAWSLNGNHLYGSVTLSQENPDIVDFGGGITPITGKEEFEYNLYKNVAYKDLPNDEIREVQTVEGSSIFIPLDVIIRFGFMMTDFFMYAEETDYCYRLRKSGVKTFIVKKSVVKHDNAGSFKTIKDISWIISYYRRRNFMRFMKEHYGWSNKKILNLKDNWFARLKFKLKCFLLPGFKKQNLHSYWQMKASVHAVKNIKNKTLDPIKYI